LTFGVGALTSCGGSASNQAVTVLGTWTGDERLGFLAMIQGFESTTGIQVQYIPTRDADAVLASELKSGNPPDLAALATPGELRQLASNGTLWPLDRALDASRMSSEYAQGWIDLMHASGPSGERHYYAVIIKAALKSVIWYDPNNLQPGVRDVLTHGLTWTRLARLSAGLARTGRPPWCIGMEDRSNSGWPGTDWIEDILLHQSGPQVYDRWVAGELPWTSAPIRRAWRTFGSVIAAHGVVSGGVQGMLLTNFGEAGQSLFTSPRKCFLEHQGSFITGYYNTQDKLSSGAGGGHPQPGTDFNFVPFPTIASAGLGSEEVSGDLLGMFRPTPAARKLIAYLTTPTAQAAWIRRPGSGAISVNRLVPLSDYPKDSVSRALAENLTHATSVRFDASDSMPAVMETAFNHAVLAFVANRAQLDELLHQLDRVRLAEY
jgi:alpha-glucoside transport system substrate-binding protein